MCLVIKHLIIKVMAETKYNKLVWAIFWFVLPLLVGLLTFLVVTTYSVKETLSVANEKVKADSELQEKMWGMIQANNIILSTKADQQSNEVEHKEIMGQIKDIDLKLDNINREMINYGYIPKIDTVCIMVNKMTQKVDTACSILSKMEENTIMFGFYKESSIVSTPLVLNEK
jgi:hypothetical protein